MAQLSNRSSFVGAGDGIEAPVVKDACFPFKADVLLFAVQVASIFLVVMAALINLSLDVGYQQLWTVVLTGSLGYLMPNPKIKVINGRPDSNGSSDEIASTSV